MTSKIAIENRYKFFYETKEDADCEISVKDGEICKTIPAHKLILGFASPVLHAMLFNKGFIESKNSAISVDDVDFETMNIFLRFVYLRDVTIKSAALALKVLYAAHKYEVEDLENICEEFLIKTFSTEDVIEILEFESKIEKPKLKDAVLKALPKFKMEAFLKADGFGKTPLNVFNMILENVQLDTIRQGVLFEAIDQYASHNEYLRTEMDIAIRKIRFRSMNIKEFKHACIQSKLLTLEEKCDIICYIVNPYNPQCAYPEGFSYIKDYYTSWETAMRKHSRNGSNFAYFLFGDPVYQKGRDVLYDQLMAYGLDHTQNNTCSSFLQKIIWSRNANALMALQEFSEFFRQ